MNINARSFWSVGKFLPLKVIPIVVNLAVNSNGADCTRFSASNNNVIKMLAVNFSLHMAGC